MVQQGGGSVNRSDPECPPQKTKKNTTCTWKKNFPLRSLRLSREPHKRATWNFIQTTIVWNSKLLVQVDTFFSHMIKNKDWKALHASCNTEVSGCILFTPTPKNLQWTKSIKYHYPTLRLNLEQGPDKEIHLSYITMNVYSSNVL